MYFTFKETFFSTYINWLVDEELDSEYDAESSMPSGEEQHGQVFFFDTFVLPIDPRSPDWSFLTGFDIQYFLRRCDLYTHTPSLFLTLDELLAAARIFFVYPFCRRSNLYTHLEARTGQ